MKRLAIIGAGLSGLTLAQHLADVMEITLFEQHTSVGGRMTTRVTTPYAFDHGAQFFTAHEPAFKRLVYRLQEAGVVGAWHARFAEIEGTQIKKLRDWDATFPHFVGVPSMAAIGQYLLAQLEQTGCVDVRLGVHVAGMLALSSGWEVMDAQGALLGQYDWVVTALPAKQAATLLPYTFQHHARIQHPPMLPCYVLMLGFESMPNLAWEVAHVRDSIISWVSVNSSKPGRNSLASLVVMSRNQWAAEHLEADDTWVVQQLSSALTELMGQAALKPSFVHLKTWQFANASKRPNPDVLIDSHQQLACCGDWSMRGRVEGAFMSASLLAEAIKHRFS